VNELFVSAIVFGPVLFYISSIFHSVKKKVILQNTLNRTFILHRYLNQQHIKKQKLSEADIIFGSMTQDAQEQMEIGELGKKLFADQFITIIQLYIYIFLLLAISLIYFYCKYLGLDIWKRNMIEPLKESLVSLLLVGIQQDRQGEATTQMTSIIQGVIESFVTVEEYKKKGNLEVNDTK
jgi:cullin 2